jgi:exodeoxyribonuclease V alpha subunit
MTELFEPVDVYDHRVADADGSLLATYNAAGVLTAGDLQIARRIATICDEPEEDVVLALALTVRAVRDGSVCLDLDRAAEVAPGLPWPEPGAWREKVAGSCVVSQGAVAVDEGLVYLDRYHRLELAVCADLSARERRAAPVVDDTVLETALDRAFPRAAAPGARDYTEQRRAAERAARSWTTVLTGGPGTGKTTTVAGLICVLADQARDGRRLSVALAAPTGKAAARLQESVLEEATDARFSDDDRRRLQHMDAVTLHRLLGWRPDNATRFRHDRGNRLKYDLVVVDESSMVELTLMARLLEATRADCRLVLVGDPHQLTSVGAGAVLGDLVRGYQGRAASRASPAPPVVTLETSHRFGDEIGALARAVREDRLDEVLERLRSGVPAIEFVEDPDPEPLLRELVLTSAREVRAAAERGDADEALRALDRHRLLCAHREGPHGVSHWNRAAEAWLAEESGSDHWPLWYAGRPLIVTSNDYAVGVYNGETGVVVRRPDGALRARISGSEGIRDLATTRLVDVDTMHALTIHKSQGSQVDEVTVLLPPADSRLLSRELFYTAITRARRVVRVIGSEQTVREAVRRRARRASGLAARLAHEAEGEAASR